LRPHSGPPMSSRLTSAARRIRASERIGGVGARVGDDSLGVNVERGLSCIVENLHTSTRQIRELAAPE
jgi:hypothetical protein